MKRIILFVSLTLALSAPSWAVSKEIIQLQQMVQALSDQVRDLKTIYVERMTIMGQLVDKSADNANKLQASIDDVKHTVETALGRQSTGTNQRLDSQQQRLQLISDSLDELKARQNKLMEQIAQMKQLLETIPPPQQQPQQPQQQAAAPVAPVTPLSPVVPSAANLYDGALKDLSEKHEQQAMQSFVDYLKFYPDGDRAENCYYYIGVIYYGQKDYAKAIEAYNQVIDRYPHGNKTAPAHLNKGIALTQMGQKDAAIREFRALIKRYPGTDEAKTATSRLRSLGVR